MNEIWLADFLALADCLNFSRAAERRHVTQPAFSRRIRALEEWCGQPLIDRSSHRLALTAAGELVRAAAADMLRRTHLLRRDLDRLETDAGTLTFASTQALSFSFFPQWFSRTGGGAAVHLLADNMQACERIMEEGRAQFLLCHGHPSMQMNLRADHYRSLTLAADRLVPVAALSAQGRALFCTDGGGTIPFLGFDQRSGLGRILRACLSDRLSGLDLQPVFTSHVAMALRQMAVEGSGLAWLPRSLVSEDIAAGRLAIAGDPAWQLDVSITLIRPRARLTPLAESFWAAARDVVAP